MKKNVFRVLGSLAILFFCFYWCMVIFFAFAPLSVTRSITVTMPILRSLFVNSYKVFTPPAISNYRLYYITQTTGQPAVTDTIEMLKNIGINKQQNAPFNQHENIIDYLVYKNVIKLIQASLLQKKHGYNPEYDLYLNNIIRYCNSELVKQRGMFAGKAAKIIITQINIPPFSNKQNKRFREAETVMVEINLNPVRP